ncbi:LysE family transporter [Alphaproteobacteria bacterium GH1-50]|uniref:LysE family transporter n=1 Tax=Kangsaoukella pontilimi TaxID=2691042 RepID=A0A7C9MY62_9RHOB|nr:LysE family translocator [Kangsaoukella pontilimi]MXQ09640.1 LysE family transporter [Kangsaoukella pontilimi]
MDMTPFLPAFIAAYAILLVGASSPGPAVAMLLGISLEQGRSAAIIASTGIAIGSATLNVLTLIGVGLILSQIAWAMMVLKLIGAGYLLYLAYGAAKKAINPPAVKVAEVTPESWPRLFLKGYLLQVTNPKAIVFWLAIAAIGATAGGGLPVIALFVAGGFVISFTCHAAWSFFLSAGHFRRLYARARRGIEATLGLFFTFAAFKLATSRT